MTVEPYRSPAAESTGDPPEEVRRRPAIAALLSLILAGGGQLYTGRAALGLAIFAAATVCEYLVRSSLLAERPWVFLTVGVVGLLLWITSIVEAIVYAHRRRRIRSRPSVRWFVLLPVFVLLFLASFVVPEPPGPQPAAVPTPAMEPSILMSERVLIDYERYHGHRPERGDLAVFRSPDSGLLQLKRVIGLGGEHVEMRGLRAVVDGDPTLDRWSFPASPAGAALMPSGFSVDVPARSVFVLGDRRDNSRDSRSYGFVAEDLLLGRAESIAYSPQLGRFGQQLHE